MAVSAYEVISTQTISGTSTSTVTFSSIPQTYTDLILITSLTQSADVSTVMRFNSDTATNYSSTRIRGTGAAASSERSSNVTGIEYWFGTLSGFGNVIWQIQNYSNATTYKSCLSRSNNTVDWMGASVGLWRSTSAISTITYTTSSGYVIAGSTFTLYGIKAAA